MLRKRQEHFKNYFIVKRDYFGDLTNKGVTTNTKLKFRTFVAILSGNLYGETFSAVRLAATKIYLIQKQLTVVVQSFIRFDT